MRFKDTKFGDLTNKEFDSSISLRSSNLTSLEGRPKLVKGSFNCSYNQLTSLEYCPKQVSNNFYCYDNKLTSLKGSPEKINGDFSCSYNNLITLKDSPKIVKGEFNCSNNPDLKNIKNQIIKYQIIAEKYITDGEIFIFESIKKEFEDYGDFLLIKEKLIKENKKIINNQDYGLSI